MNDNISKLAEESNTILITETNTINSNRGYIRFKFSDNEVADYEYNTINSINPLLFNNINPNTKIEIKMPNFVKKKNLNEFFFIIKNGYIELEDYSYNKIINLLKICEFFKNETITIQFIKHLIIEKLSDDNCFDYLIYSFNQLNNQTPEFESEKNNIYFDLFYKCLEIIGKDENLILSNIERIKHLDKKLVNEILQKSFSHLLYGNYLLVESETSNSISNEIEAENYFDTISGNKKLKENNNFLSLQNFSNLINLLYEIYQCKNFFDLLTLEYMQIFSSESINELNSQPNPTFQVKIPIDGYENYYEEYPIDIFINNKCIIIVMFYKISDDSFNVCIKLGDNPNINKKENNSNNINNNLFEENYCFKIFTFLSIIELYQNNSNINLSSQTNLKCLSNNKSMHSIFKLTNFTKILNKSKTELKDNSLNMNNNNLYDEYFSIIIKLKLCYIYSVLTSYLLKYFNYLCNNNNIHKISKNLLLLILKNKYLNKNSENDIVIALNKWLNDEINIKEDITELFDFIKWEKVDDENIFEFIIKYGHMINGNKSYENMFINAFIFKYKNNQIVSGLIINFIKAVGKIEYSNIFTCMKKNEKFNAAYMSMNMSTSNNIGNSNKKIINSNDFILNENNNKLNNNNNVSSEKVSVINIKKEFQPQTKKHHRNYSYNNIGEIKINFKEKSLTKNNSYNNITKNPTKIRNVKKNNNNDQFINFLLKHNFESLPLRNNYSKSKCGTMKKLSLNNSKIFNNKSNINKNIFNDVKKFETQKLSKNNSTKNFEKKNSKDNNNKVINNNINKNSCKINNLITNKKKNDNKIIYLYTNANKKINNIKKAQKFLICKNNNNNNNRQSKSVNKKINYNNNKNNNNIIITYSKK